MCTARRLGHAHGSRGARGEPRDSGMHSRGHRTLRRGGVQRALLDPLLIRCTSSRSWTERSASGLGKNPPPHPHRRRVRDLRARVTSSRRVVAQDIWKNDLLYQGTSRALLRALRHGALLARGGPGAETRDPSCLRFPLRTSRGCSFLGWTTHAVDAASPRGRWPWRRT